MNKMTQRKKVLEHLEKIGPISSLGAFRFYNITRLAAIIFDLREMGYQIDTTMVDTETKEGFHTRYAMYTLRRS